MKRLLWILCSIMVLTCSLSAPTLASGDEIAKNTEKVVLSKAEPSKQGRFDRMTKRQYLITAAVVAASAATSYYCSGDACSGIAEAITNATPGMVAYFGLSSLLAAYL